MGYNRHSNSNLNDLVRRQSFHSDSGMIHPGSYQGGGMTTAQQMAYNNVIHAQLRTNASMPAEESIKPVNFGDGKPNDTQG